MNIESSKRMLKVLTITLTVFAGIIVGIFVFLFFQPQIVPPSETFGSFWMKNFSILLAAFTFAFSALAAAHNFVEQRQLRYMENYPYLEVFPVLSVDPLPWPVPRMDVPSELHDFNTEYLKTVAPSRSSNASDIEFRYLAVAFRNVGHGLITKISISGRAVVPNSSFGPRNFKVERRFNLPAEQTKPVTLLPISDLPQFEVLLESLEYSGYFVRMKEFDGQGKFEGTYPYSIAEERRETLFVDDFQNIPAGLGWVLDFWGQWQPTSYMHVPRPTGNEHYLLLSGDKTVFNQHFNQQGGAHKDLTNSLMYGQTVQVRALVRSTPRTTASIQIWCHDMATNPKNRSSRQMTPSDDWQEISMLYTCTQTPHLRIHLLYFPGDGEIHVDKITVEKLYT